MLISKALTSRLKKANLPFLITTTNLVLRPLLNEDVSAVTAVIAVNLADLKRWLPWLGEDMKQISSKQLTEHFYQEAKEHQASHMVVYNNQNLIGMISLYGLSDNGLTANLGYWFNSATDKRMSNIFKEALRAVAQFAFNEWKVLTLTIPCVAGNFFSEVTAKELKFKLKRIDLTHGKTIKTYDLNSFEFASTIEMNVVHESK